MLLVAHPTDDKTMRDLISKWIREYDGTIPLVLLQQKIWEKFRMYATVYDDREAILQGLEEFSFPVNDGMVSCN